MSTRIQTKSYRLVGTTIYRASALRMVPLDDPTAYGNNGVEGFDEDYVGREFKSKPAAVRWLGQQMASDEHCYSGEVTKVGWEADEFDDPSDGLHVLDGIETRSWVWYYRLDGGKAVLDDEGPAW